MSALQKSMLTLVLLFTGLLAGLQVLMLMGVLPAMMRMPLATYAGMWQALDHFVAARMPIFANGTLLFYVFLRLAVSHGLGGDGSSGLFWAVWDCCWRTQSSL